MPPLRAIATALHGSSPKMMTTSVVMGESKDALYLDPIIGTIAHRIGADGGTVTNAVEEFLHLVRGVVQQQRAILGKQVAVPVVYGSDTEFTGPETVYELVQSFHDRLGKLTTLGNRDFIRHMESQGTSLPQIVQTSYKLILEQLMRTTTEEGDIQYEIRDYMSAQATLGITPRMATQGQELIVPASLRSEFEGLYRDDAMRVRDCRAALEAVVRKIALQFARHSLLMRDEHGNVINRFISAHGEKNLDSGDIRNLIFLDDDLRRIYAETFMDENAIRHNVCFKSAIDRPAPPFADIAATFLADRFDAFYGTRPTAVRVRGV